MTPVAFRNRIDELVTLAESALADVHRARESAIMSVEVRTRIDDALASTRTSLDALRSMVAELDTGVRHIRQLDEAEQRLLEDKCRCIKESAEHLRESVAPLLNREDE